MRRSKYLYPTWWARNRFGALMAAMITAFGITIAAIILKHERRDDEFRRWCVEEAGGQIVETSPLVCVTGNVEIKIRR